MPQPQRRIRTEFWAGLIFVALLAYALIANWWKEHAVLGWVMLGIVVALLAFSLYRFPTFRARLFKTAKTATDGLIHEPTQSTAVSTPESMPVPALTPRERDLFINYIGNKCERPDCREQNVHNIHHIKPREEGGKNSVWNLIVLCPTHHAYADRGIPARSQQHLWAQRHSDERYRLLRSGKWPYR
jgi:hypothetical protein